jgi:hypothetical protein
MHWWCWMTMFVVMLTGQAHVPAQQIKVMVAILR